jgi:predicted ATP-grasp superfamily ATP-dependent carboligase
MTKTLVASVLAALTLTLAGCGNSDDDEAAKAISDSIMKEQGKAGGDVFVMKREEADCIGEGFVDNIGTEQLQDYGFLTEDLETADKMSEVKMSTEDAEAASGTLFDCADVQAMMSKAMGDVPAEAKECLDKVMTEDALRDMFTLMFSGKQEAASQKMVKPMMECAASGMP